MDRADYIWLTYDADGDNLLCSDELHALIRDWMHGNFPAEPPTELPWWFNETDEVLYGGLNPDVKRVVTLHDMNGDDRVIMSEFLKQIGIAQETAAALTEEYKWDSMWWRIPEFMGKAIGAIPDWEGRVDKIVTAPELYTILDFLAMPDQLEHVLYLYGGIGATQLTIE